MNGVDIANSRSGERVENTRRTVLRAAVSAGLLGYSLAHSTRADGRPPPVRDSSPPVHGAIDARETNGEWVQARLTAEDAAAGDWFGRSVSLDGSRVLVGASRKEATARESGVAYVFRVEPRSSPVPPTATTVTDPPASTEERSTQTDTPTGAPTETTPPLRDGFPGWPTIGGVALVGVIVGLLTSNTKDEDTRKTGLGLLAAIFGGGVLITTLQMESGGWVGTGIAAGVIGGIFVGVVLREIGFTFS